jgi:uncharacterized glyoxalase superfamily protein PhnB
MIHQVVPQFFTVNLDATLAYYREALGFETQFVYGEPAFYAGAIRDEQSIFFRVIHQPLPVDPLKSEEEHLDAYIIVKDIDALYAEYSSRRVTFARDIANQPWSFREFVVRDCDGRLLCFGKSTDF